MATLSNKIAVVTGAGRGIGKHIAETLAAHGARVAVISRTLANAESASAEINAKYPNSTLPYALDVADFAATQEIGKKILTDLGNVDILVNNAGVTKDTLMLRMTDEDWDLVLDTNLKGAFNTVKAFQRVLLKQKDARIINISSVIGLIGNAGQANYAASKAGLIGFTKSLAREFASRGVTVNAIAPGFIETDMTHVLNEQIRDEVLKKIPLAAFGQAEDISSATLFLASPAARYITGQVLAVDGGMVM
jgi:3-oxoacyl-[acyl-carrier protein] reductase